MEEQFFGDVPCSSLAVESVIRVGTSGALWGLCASPYDASKKGLTGTARASFVYHFLITLGLFAGVFSITRCGMRQYRGKNDRLNAFIAGAAAGAAVAAASSRRWNQVIEMAGLLSIFGAAADYYNLI